MEDFILDLALVNMNLNNKVRLGIKSNFNAIKISPTPYGELGFLIYHLFETINLWLNRITGKDEPIIKYEELKTKDQFYVEWIKTDKRFLSYAKENENKIDYTQIIRFINRLGEKEDYPLKELILHISHHSFYHRGQIASFIRVNNFEPLPDLDWSKN